MVPTWSSVICIAMPCISPWHGRQYKASKEALVSYAIYFVVAWPTMVSIPLFFVIVCAWLKTQTYEGGLTQAHPNFIPSFLEFKSFARNDQLFFMTCIILIIIFIFILKKFNLFTNLMLCLWTPYNFYLKFKAYYFSKLHMPSSYYYQSLYVTFYMQYTVLCTMQ